MKLNIPKYPWLVKVIFQLKLVLCKKAILKTKRFSLEQTNPNQRSTNPN